MTAFRPAPSGPTTCCPYLRADRHITRRDRRATYVRKLDEAMPESAVRVSLVAGFIIARWNSAHSPRSGQRAAGATAGQSGRSAGRAGASPGRLEPVRPVRLPRSPGSPSGPPPRTTMRARLSLKGRGDANRRRQFKQFNTSGYSAASVRSSSSARRRSISSRPLTGLRSSVRSPLTASSAARRTSSRA